MKTSIWSASVLALVVALGAAPAFAEQNAYLKLKGQKTGDVKGSVTQKGLEGTILVTAVSHGVVSPRDAASGLPTGKRQHKPIVLTIPLDKAAPLLENLLVNNENIQTFELKFYRQQIAAAGAGRDTNYYTIKLTNANIAGIDLRMLDNRKPELAPFTMYLEVAFTYQKIEWIWTEGGITADDEWQAPTT